MLLEGGVTSISWGAKYMCCLYGTFCFSLDIRTPIALVVGGGEFAHPFSKTVESL